jgi:hypothetical protein
MDNEGVFFFLSLFMQGSIRNRDETWFCIIQIYPYCIYKIYFCKWTPRFSILRILLAFVKFLILAADKYMLEAVRICRTVR